MVVTVANTTLIYYLDLHLVAGEAQSVDRIIERSVEGCPRWPVIQLSKFGYHRFLRRLMNIKSLNE